MFNIPFEKFEQLKLCVCTLCSHRGRVCVCTVAQQYESTYTACLQEKLEGAKQLIWVPEHHGDRQQHKRIEPVI